MVAEGILDDAEQPVALVGEAEGRPAAFSDGFSAAQRVTRLRRQWTQLRPATLMTRSKKATLPWA